MSVTNVVKSLTPKTSYPSTALVFIMARSRSEYCFIFLVIGPSEFMPINVDADLRTLQVQFGDVQDNWECDVGVDLNEHSKKIAEGENKGKFQCSLCGKISRDKTNAFAHVENIHFPGSFEHDCDQCDKKFDTKKK